MQVYALAGHARVGTRTCISAIDLVHGFVNMHAAQPSAWHFSALVLLSIEVQSCPLLDPFLFPRTADCTLTLGLC